MTPELKLSPGTTCCIDCGAVVVTPNNTLDSEWMRQHVGHTVRMFLNTSDFPPVTVEHVAAWKEINPGMHKTIHESPYGKAQDNYHLRQSADHLYVDLTYPPYTDDANENPVQVRYVVVNQESVRASDGVRLSYDYERDGFVIEQASTFQWEAGDTECDPDWQEVAFVESWARERKPDFLSEDNDQ